MLQRAVLLVLTSLLVPVVFAGEHGVANPQGRRLLQAAFCPDGCEDGFCQQSGTPGGLRCAKCQNNLLADKATGLCVCPKGKYTTGEPRCIDCPKGSFCTGGIYSTDRPPVNESCPQFMTTQGLRAQSARSCVNMPGYSYSITSAGVASATLCPLNTYGPGLKKQRACVPCPTGFTTDGAVGRTTPTACVVPAGYYLKTPGQAAPCPMGEWKSGTSADGNCRKCAAGVTTASEGSTSARECKVVTKGYYASSFDTDGAVNGTTICPQGSYCPGGNQTQVTSGRRLAQTSSTGIIACPNGQWTMMPGAINLEQCLTPPGHYTDTTLGITARCPDGHFRADWLPAAPSCTPCGVGVKADRNDRVRMYYPNGTEEELPITTSSADCYIQAGQGLYFETLTKTWRTKDCTLNSYGVTNTTYGLTPAPCRDCPQNMVANRNLSTSAPYYTANADGTGGFTNEMACVTKPGFGMSGRAAQRCDQGYYNPGNNYETCKACTFGLTTSGPGAGRTSADCITDKGYGFFNSKMGECPIGTYNDALVQNASIACKACPVGKTTPKAGADSLSDCQLCAPGYGGLNCGTLCGGVSGNATYGPPGRASFEGQATPCQECSANGQTVTYSYNYQFENDIFTPRTVARIGAASPVECLSEYSQINDGSYYLPISATEDPSGNTVFKVENVPNLAACITECDNRECQLVTYEYVTKDCYVRISLAPKYEGAPWLALKVLPSGYVGTSPWSIKEAADTGRALALSTGMYVFYQEHLAEAVGIQVLPNVISPTVNRNTFTSVRECLTACDDAGDKCSGVTVLSTVAPIDIGKTCMFVTANTQPGVFKRTMIRADVNRLLFPSSFLCPSGYTADANGVTPCAPSTAPVVVTLFLRSQGNCADLIVSVRNALLAFLSDPNQAFGVYTPGLSVTVGCFVVPEGQARRRLQQSGVVDLYTTITYGGTQEGGLNLLSNLTSSDTSIPGIEATVTGGSVVSAAIGSLPPASITTVAQDYVPGQPFVFTASYFQGTQPTAAALQLLFSPEDSMTCNRAVTGTGVTTFTCTPLVSNGTIVATAQGPNPQDPNAPVQSSVTLQVVLTSCLKGSVLDSANSKCVPCAKGTYAAVGDANCTNCPAGSTTPGAFSGTIDDCTLCVPGREGSNCTLCAANKWSAGGTKGAGLVCAACPTNAASTEGSDALADCACPAGRRLDEGKTACVTCAQNFYGVGGSVTAPPVCTACPTNATSNEGSGALADCACPAGTRLNEGTTACVQCAANFYGTGGSVTTLPNCTACPTGAISGAGSGALEDCACPAGTKLDVAKTECVPCESDTFGLGGKVTTLPVPVCTLCPDTATSGTGSVAVTDCECPAGQRLDAAATPPVCVPCGINTYRVKGGGNTTVCTECPANTESAEGADALDKCYCVAGRAGTNCPKCPAGQYSAGGQEATCNPCDIGTYSGEGAASCTLCTDIGVGLTTKTTGSTSFENCTNCQNLPDVPDLATLVTGDNSCPVPGDYNQVCTATCSGGLTSTVVATCRPTWLVTGCCVPATFDTYDLGSIGPALAVESFAGQKGWTTTDNFPKSQCRSDNNENNWWDQEVKHVEHNGQPQRVWRMSNAVSTFGFSACPCSYSSCEPAGELVTDGQPRAALWNDRGPTGCGPAVNNHGSKFNANATSRQFSWLVDFRSVTGLPQADLHIELCAAARQSPWRQTYLRIVDTGAGFDVRVKEMTATASMIYTDETSTANTQSNTFTVATGLSYTDIHTLETKIYFVDGISEERGLYVGNDIVEVFLNGTLIHTGSTWEALYMGWNKELIAPPRKQAVDALMFRTEKPNQLGNLNNGFYFSRVVVTNPPARV